ncbi:MAG TPA: cytochrome c [Gemmataceae bacterium]|nr:cytochrome c [Gemmataceae bacterium]
MRTHKVLAAGAALLALALVCLTAGQAADEKDMKDKLDKLVKTGTDKPADVEKAGADFAKANKIDNESIKDVMDFLGKRDPKKPNEAWGIGKTPGDIKPDGIELKLREMAKKALSKAQLAKEQDALAEIGARTRAIGSISLASPPKKALPGKDPKDWKKWSEDMIKASAEFDKAVKGGKPNDIKDAATKLNSSCVDCHGTFRD